ncbi:MAG: histone deacetylase [Spirulinaceae cyanobacterium]
MFPVIYSDEFLEHKTGRLHPESPQRLTAIVKALKQVDWADKITWQLPTSITKRDVLIAIQRVQDQQYINLVQAIAQEGGGRLDADTTISPHSYNIALLAVSAWLDGVDSVTNSNSPAFVLSRPPGHHAEQSTGMGFCLFSNAAIAAYYALEKKGCNRVAILDWDVHHGNGTQAIVESNPQIIYCSLHQYPCYPGTGKAEEKGKYNNVLNLPMKPGSTIQQYLPIFENKVVPFLRDFQPDLLIISAGYDANHADPLASISLQPQDYQLFTHYCLGITKNILFGLEGGYDLETLAESVIKTIEICLTIDNYSA